ncbi:N-acetylmuramoyl-L-alanine amidase [Ferruginibacter yonginensis]|uniref:N-acetylmuramoyl-L-alanine amidase n=1 Tax=Ferruginibacter yonginensis TaxID=1310416 RepID=A0ABV8QPM1_9BACT
MIRKGCLLLCCFFLIGAVSNKSAAQAKKLRTIVVDAGHGGEDAGAVAVYENSLRSKEKDVTLAISKKVVAELKKQLPDVKVVPTRTTDVFDNVRVKANIANEAKGDLFLCIHADSGPLKTGRRQTGTRTVTRYKITYKGKGKRRKKISTPYEAVEPVYEYFKMPLQANGTSVYIFAAPKTGDKLNAIMKNGDAEDVIMETATEDSVYNSFNFNSPEGRQLAQIYAKLYQEKSDRIATYVNDEIAATGRKALGVKQRQVGIWVLSATKMPAILVETGYINNPEDERYLNSEEGQQELAEAITRAVIRYKNQLESTKSVGSGTGTNNKP